MSRSLPRIMIYYDIIFYYEKIRMSSHGDTVLSVLYIKSLVFVAIDQSDIIMVSARFQYKTDEVFVKIHF